MGVNSERNQFSPVKGKFLQEQILPHKHRPFWKGFVIVCGSKEEVIKVVSLGIFGANMVMYQYTLKKPANKMLGVSAMICHIATVLY